MSNAVAYRASAGTGKTFALSVRYLSLLFMGANPRDIVALTFTNKATSEMKSRIAKYLMNLTSDNNLEGVLSELMTQSGLGKEDILALQPELLDKFLTTFTHISTLDSFFGSILRSQSLEVGIDPDFEAIENRDKTKVKEIFLDELHSVSLLPLLVRVSLEIGDREFNKIFGILDQFYKNENILPKIKYENIDILPILESIKKLKDTMLDKLVHLKANNSAINNFSEEDLNIFIGKDLFKKDSLLEHTHYKVSAKKDTSLENDFLKLKQLINDLILAKQNNIFADFFIIYDYYKNAIIKISKDEELLAFDDISTFAHKILSDETKRDFVYFKLDSKIKHILLDEFQDTSMMQYLMLKPMLDEITSGVGQHGDFRSMFVVGDTKQSLYRWRGGEEKIFSLLLDRYSISPRDMNINYRSSKNIIAKTNEWFMDKMDDFVPQITIQDAIDGYVQVLEASRESIIEDTIKTISRLNDSGINLSDIVILVFTNDDGMQLYLECEKRGITTILKTRGYIDNISNLSSIVSFVEFLYHKKEIDGFNFLARYGIEKDNYDISWFNPFMNPVEVIDIIVKDFGYRNDKNLLRLLEFASKYSDIDEFLKSYKKTNIQLAKGSDKGAIIMTINASKGLEFEHVIIMDKIKGEKNGDYPFLYKKDKNLFIEKIFLRDKILENFSNEYRDAVSKENNENKKDKLNKLYVALTRAISGMTVIKKDEKSQFDILSMDTISIGTIEIEKKEQKISKNEYCYKIISKYGLQSKKSEEDISSQSYKAIIFGNAMHYTLEMLGMFDIFELENALFHTKRKFGKMLLLSELEDIKRRIVRLLQNEEFQKLCIGAKIIKEATFCFNGEIKRIDLLLEQEDKLVIIDYKSSKNFSDKHLSQVSYYQKATAQITSKVAIAKIVYLLEDKIEILSLN
jgi:exodeoxyribonuclease V beta subunit